MSTSPFTSPLFFSLTFTCYRFRRMRVVTLAGAIRLRFGK
jgi:hypothetical protein